MRIGAYDVQVLTIGHFRMDGGGLFGVLPKKLWQRSYPQEDDDNRVLMAARVLLVLGEGVVLVADMGLGEKLEAKSRNIFSVEQPENALLVALARYNLTPEAVTHCVYTHLHFDHAGGSTRFDESGNAVPVFPNAKHFVQTEQLAWARSPSDKDRASFLPANWEPVVAVGLLSEISGQVEILPGIECIPVHGHTPAMQMLLVRGEGTGVLYTIDLFPTATHLPAHYIAAFDNHPLTVLDEKKRVLDQAVDENLVLLFGHDATLAGATVKRGGRAFEIEKRYGPDEI
jgi:glyoxylase-like metal-dependent hydrolase (beta-lactamase superfamily II)